MLEIFKMLSDSVKYRSILQIFEETNPAIRSLNHLHLSKIIFRNHSLFSIIQPGTCSYASFGPASNNLRIKVRESWHEVGGIRDVSWIHCDAFHVELFVLPGGVQFGEPRDATAGNPDTSATVSATKTPSRLTADGESWRLRSLAMLEARCIEAA